MTSSQQPPFASGFMLCMVQATDSMRRQFFDKPAPTKIGVAIQMTERLIDELLALTSTEASDGLPVEVDVGVVAYRTSPDGLTRLEWLLAGTSLERPLVPLRSLAARRSGIGRSSRVQTLGVRPTCAALDYTRGLLARWASDHPGAVRPLVIHCSDGESADGPHEAAAEAIRAAVPDAFLVQCLFRERAIPSAFTPIPPLPSGNLWAMSSAMPNDDPPSADHPPRRALLVNMPSSARILGGLIRQLWSKPSVGEPVPDVDCQAGSIPGTNSEPAFKIVAEPAPERPPRFRLKPFWMSKRGNTDTQWEDGFAADPGAGVLAVADGASDGVFTKSWVTLLLKSYLVRPIPLDDRTEVERWLSEQRQSWRSSLRYEELRWSLQRRVDTSCGAATFLAFLLDPPGAEEGGPVGWTAWAVGDVCLFHIREGRLIGAFPIDRSSDFGYTPPLYQSKALRENPVACIRRGEISQDELILFATDAFAQHLLAAVESGDPPNWSSLPDVSLEDWRANIERLRDEGAIINDDCTLLALSLMPSDPDADSAASTQVPLRKATDAPAEDLDRSPGADCTTLPTDNLGRLQQLPVEGQESHCHPLAPDNLDVNDARASGREMGSSCR